MKRIFYYDLLSVILEEIGAFNIEGIRGIR